MTHTIIGQNKNKSICKRALFCALACIGLFVSCTQKETITDVYYIHNECDQSIVLEIYPRFWDTCSVYSIDTYSYVEFGGSEVTLLPGQTIRLHPICRKSENPNAVHQPNPLDGVISPRAKLIVGNDTIEWQSDMKVTPPLKTPCMFTNDTTWSIYNTTCWQTVPDAALPYTFYNTFSITETDIERSKTL